MIESGSFIIFHRSTVFIPRSEIEDGLGNVRPDIEHVEGTDDRLPSRSGLETERSQIYLLLLFIEACGDFGQQLAQSQQARAARNPDRLLAEVSSKIVSQAAIKGL
jgi:hypothetical protein